jgi:hypothetical protein
VPSIATIAAPLSGTLRGNNADEPAADGSTARILSADSAASAADVPIASPGALDFRDGL